jgi:hypothetical protein
MSALVTEELTAALRGRFFHSLLLFPPPVLLISEIPQQNIHAARKQSKNYATGVRPACRQDHAAGIQPLMKKESK